jgi:hypothetical protein
MGSMTSVVRGLVIGILAGTACAIAWSFAAWDEAGWASARSRAQTPAGVTAFIGARIIDGSGSPPIEDGVLVVRDGRIAAVGSSTKVSVPEGAIRVALKGQTIAPGLINAHGHVDDVRGMKSSAEFYTPEHIKHQLGVRAIWRHDGVQPWR